MDQLLYVMQMNNLQPTVVPPGSIDVTPEEQHATDGYPSNMGKLKGLCKKRGIKFSNKDKRVDLIAKLDQVTTVARLY